MHIPLNHYERRLIVMIICNNCLRSDTSTWFWYKLQKLINRMKYRKNNEPEWMNKPNHSLRAVYLLPIKYIYSIQHKLHLIVYKIRPLTFGSNRVSFIKSMPVTSDWFYYSKNYFRLLLHTELFPHIENMCTIAFSRFEIHFKKVFIPF